MKAARLIRSLPALLVVWLAVLCLQVAQPGALVHHWEHALEAAHAGTPQPGATSAAASQHAAHADHEGEACSDAGHAPESVHDGLCHLCAHFAFLGGLQSGRSCMPDVAVAQSQPVPAQPDLPNASQPRERYAARAPPVLLS